MPIPRKPTYYIKPKISWVASLLTWNWVSCRIIVEIAIFCWIINIIIIGTISSWMFTFSYTFVMLSLWTITGTPQYLYLVNDGFQRAKREIHASICVIHFDTISQDFFQSSLIFDVVRIFLSFSTFDVYMTNNLLGHSTIRWQSMVFVIQHLLWCLCSA